MPMVLTAGQMQALERAAIDSGRVTGLALMERAGAGVAAAIEAQWPDMAGPEGWGRHAVILCGPGNNGGDGFVIARLLRDRGWGVTVLFDDDPGSLPPDARTNHDRWLEMTGGRVRPGPIPYGDFEFISMSHAPGGVFIDALFGIGFRPPLEEARDEILEEIHRLWFLAGRTWRGVAVDIPSGYLADLAGQPPDMPPPEDDLVVTFHAEKPVHGYLRSKGVPVVVVDIGL